MEFRGIELGRDELPGYELPALIKAYHPSNETATWDTQNWRHVSEDIIIIEYIYILYWTELYSLYELQYTHKISSCYSWTNQIQRPSLMKSDGFSMSTYAPSLKIRCVPLVNHHKLHVFHGHLGMISLIFRQSHVAHILYPNIIKLYCLDPIETIKTSVTSQILLSAALIRHITKNCHENCYEIHWSSPFLDKTSTS